MFSGKFNQLVYVHIKLETRLISSKLAFIGT